MKRVKAACICQTLHFMTKEEEQPESAIRWVRQEVEQYKKGLERNTTRLTTTVVVRPESLLDTPLIRSFHVSNKYVNYTDFSILDSYDSFTVSTNSPINYLEGSHDSSQSFVSGHEIAISVTISNVVLDNGTWSGSPVTASRRVTIR